MGMLEELPYPVDGIEDEYFVGLCRAGLKD
jgi:hypothetical protein